jgi:signal transduction histidine kinase
MASASEQATHEVTEHAILYGLTASIARREPLASVFERAFDALKLVLGAERAAVLQFDTQGVMRFQAWRGISDAYRSAVEGHSPWRADERAPAPIWVADVQEDAAWEPYRALFRSEQIRALGFLPIVSGESLLGKFMVYYRSPRAVSERECHTAQAIAAHIATAIDQRASERDREQAALRIQAAHRRASALYGVTSELANCASQSEVLDVVVTSGFAAVGACAGGVLELSEDGTTLEVLKATGHAEPAVERVSRIPLDAPLPAADAARRREAVFLSTPEQLAQVYPRLCVQLEEQRSRQAWAAIPLVASGRVVGVLTLSYAHPRGFEEEERFFLVTLAQQCAQAIHRRRGEEHARALESRAALEREQLISELSRTVRFSELLTGILAHDLRTPLSAIGAVSALLAGPEAPAQLARLSEVLRSSSRRMARMVDQLLDFTHVRLGRGIPLRFDEGDLGRIVRAVLDEIESAHPDCRIERELLGDLRGAWDADRIAQLLTNLCVNACQHGHAPIRLRLDGRDLAQLRIRVENQGCIDPRLLPTLFEPLQLGKRDQGSSGLGLGLHISQQIVLGHGGSIEVASTPEDGTCFELTLPRRPDPEHAAAFLAPEA